MSSRKILVIDDEDDAVAFVNEVLQQEGTQMLSARDGAAGVKAAREHLPDLIILDVQMPKKDGFTALVELRHDEATRNIPVVMLTGVGQKTGVRFSAADMGDFIGIEPDAYVEKPVDPAQLKATVDAVLSS